MILGRPRRDFTMRARRFWHGRNTRFGKITFIDAPRHRGSFFLTLALNHAAGRSSVSRPAPLLRAHNVPTPQVPYQALARKSRMAW